MSNVSPSFLCFSYLNVIIINCCCTVYKSHTFTVQEGAGWFGADALKSTGAGSAGGGDAIGRSVILSEY